MARETKVDRTVRAITEQTTEHLHELKNFESNPNIYLKWLERCARLERNKAA